MNFLRIVTTIVITPLIILAFERIIVDVSNDLY